MPPSSADCRFQPLRRQWSPDHFRDSVRFSRTSSCSSPLALNQCILPAAPSFTTARPTLSWIRSKGSQRTDNPLQCQIHQEVDDPPPGNVYEGPGDSGERLHLHRSSFFRLLNAAKHVISKLRDSFGRAYPIRHLLIQGPKAQPCASQELARRTRFDTRYFGVQSQDGHSSSLSVFPDKFTDHES